MNVGHLIYNVRWYLLVLLAFCFLFAFRIPVAGNAAYLSMCLLVLLLFTSEKALNNFLSLLRDQVFVIAVALYLLIIFFAAFATVINNAFDFTFITPLVNGLFSLIACVALVSLLHAWCANHTIIDLLVWLIISQVVIIFIMLLVPGLRDAIQTFTLTEHQVSRLQGYHGIRGLGISGSVAFGLAVVMGALGFVLHYWFAFSKRKQTSMVTFILFVMCLIASLTTGRTAILGFAIGFLLYFNAHSINSILVRFWKQVILGALVVVILALYISRNEFLTEVAFFYSKYVFQFIWRYLETGEAVVTSLQALERMYFVPPNENWLLGDGYYHQADGSYYLRTDAGYMRFLLFFGFVGSLIVYLSFLFLSFLFACRNTSAMPSAKLFFFIYAVMAFVFHYKGDVVLYNVGFMKIFFMVGFYYLLKSKTSKLTGSALPCSELNLVQDK